MKTFLTLAALAALAMVGLHINARITTWQLSLDVYETTVDREMDAIQEIGDVAKRDPGTVSAEDVRSSYQILDQLDAHLREMAALLNHKPYDLGLNAKEEKLLGRVAGAQIKLTQVDRRPSGPMPGTDSPVAPAAARTATMPQPNPRATPDPRQVAEDIARKYGAKPAP